MKLNRPLFTIMLALTALEFGSCVHKCFDTHNPECSDYNPCWDKQPTSAAFLVEEDNLYGKDWTLLHDPSSWKYIDLGDSVSGGYDQKYPSYIYFEPKDTNADYYEWHIGGGVYKKKTVQLSVDSSWNGKSTSVTLIVHKKPLVSCFPSDDGIDTMSRTIYFKYYKENPITGWWLGSNTDNPTDTFSIFIELYSKNVNSIPKKSYPIWTKNFPKGSPRDPTWDSGHVELLLYGYRQVGGSIATTVIGMPCKDVIDVGFDIWLGRDNETINIDYSYSDYLNTPGFIDPGNPSHPKRYAKSFIGKRK